MSAVYAIRPGERTSHAAASDSQAGLAHKCLYYMTLMREVEDRIERKLYRQGKIVGGVYVGRGQEAIPVGTALPADARRRAFSVAIATWRCSSSAACRSAAIFAQYMGRVDGLTRGRDGNMHMGDLKPQPGVDHQRAGRHRPGSRGGGHGAASIRARTGVAFSYFGDGATSRGDWHEGVNLATVQKAPVHVHLQQQPVRLFHAAESADGLRQCGRPRSGLQHAGRDRGRQRRAGGLRRHRARAGARARRQRSVPAGVQDIPHDRPFRARCARITFRRNCSTSGARWTRSCGCKPRCWNNGWATQGEMDTCARASAQEIDEAVAWAEKSPFPDPATLLDDVYESQYPCPQPIWKPSAKGCGKRWSATPTSSCWAKISASTAAHSR